MSKVLAYIVPVETYSGTAYVAISRCEKSQMYER